MTLLTSMNIAQQALLVNQAALNVITNNVSNINTEGYSRQRVQLSPEVNYTPIGGSVLNQVYANAGVALDGVTRYTDQYLQSYFRQQTSLESYLTEFSQTATGIENVTNELNGNGLSSALKKFFEAAQTLNLSPADSTARQNYIQQAQTFAIKLNTMSSNLSETRKNLVGDISIPGSLEDSKAAKLTATINDKLSQLSKINADIVKVTSPGMSPNNLLDLRDKLVDELSKLIPVEASENENGTLNISLNGISLVKGTKMIGELKIRQGDANNPAVIDIYDFENNPISQNINSYINNGQLGAILDAGGSRTDILTLKGTLDGLDKLANGFATIINDIQTLAGADGTPMAIDKVTKQLIASTEPIFQSSTGGAINAANIKINSNVLSNPYLIAAARVNPASYDVNAIGNNSNMIKVLDIRGQNSSALGNNSPEGYLSALVGEIGVKVSNIKSNLKSQSLVLTQVENQFNSIKGVNMDEEIIDLTKYQRAYQASARVYSVCNELLDVLVNLGR